jgi:hypothetical protein
VHVRDGVVAQPAWVERPANGEVCVVKVRNQALSATDRMEFDTHQMTAGVFGWC